MSKKKLIFTIQTVSPKTTNENETQVLTIKFASEIELTWSKMLGQDNVVWKIKEMDFVMEKGQGGETQYDLLKEGVGQTFELELDEEQIFGYPKNVNVAEEGEHTLYVWEESGHSNLYHYKRKNSDKWKNGEITLKKTSSGPDIPGVDKDAQIAALQAKIDELEQKLRQKPNSDTSEEDKKEIQRLKKEIDRLKKNKSKDQSERPNPEKFPWLLVVGGGLIVVLLIIIVILVSRSRSASKNN